MTSTDNPDGFKNPSSGFPGNSSADSGPPRSRRRRFFRYLINAWLIMHLTAIFTAPATVGPSSSIARGYWDVVSPYLQVLYLNHGFHYFAPQPGSSNLVRWEAHSETGEIASDEFPNFDIQPRLLYHRYFMLSEFLGNSSDELKPDLATAYANHLLKSEAAEMVRLTQVRHDLPSMERIRAGGSVNDPDLFEETGLGQFSRLVAEDALP